MDSPMASVRGQWEDNHISWQELVPSPPPPHLHILLLAPPLEASVSTPPSLISSLMLGFLNFIYFFFNAQRIRETVRLTFHIDEQLSISV